jgi:hypothetical protein
VTFARCSRDDDGQILSCEIVGNSNLYLSLISAAGMILVAVAAVMVWRHKTKLSHRWFFLGDVLSAPAAPMTFLIRAPLGELFACRLALGGIPILRWCEAHLSEANVGPLLVPQAVMAN